MVVEVAAQCHDIVRDESGAHVSNDGGNVLRLASNFGLFAQWLQLATNFARQVGEASEVRLHRIEFADRLFFTPAVFENSGCFLDEAAAVFGRRRQHGVEPALTDDDVHFPPKPGVREKFLHIEKAARLTVDRIFGLAVSEQDA